jgi:hypothetical protein
MIKFEELNRILEKVKQAPGNDAVTYEVQGYKTAYNLCEEDYDYSTVTLKMGLSSNIYLDDIPLKHLSISQFQDEITMIFSVSHYEENIFQTI